MAVCMRVKAWRSVAGDLSCSPPFFIEAQSLTGSRAACLASLAPASLVCQSGCTHSHVCMFWRAQLPHACRRLCLQDRLLSLPVLTQGPCSSSLASACYLARLDLELLILLPRAGIPGVCNKSPLLAHSCLHSSAFVPSSLSGFPRVPEPFLGKERPMWASPMSASFVSCL